MYMQLLCVFMHINSGLPHNVMHSSSC